MRDTQITRMSSMSRLSRHSASFKATPPSSNHGSDISDPAELTLSSNDPAAQFRSFTNRRPFSPDLAQGAAPPPTRPRAPRDVHKGPAPDWKRKRDAAAHAKKKADKDNEKDGQRQHLRAETRIFRNYFSSLSKTRGEAAPPEAERRDYSPPNQRLLNLKQESRNLKQEQRQQRLRRASFESQPEDDLTLHGLRNASFSSQKSGLASDSFSSKAGAFQGRLKAGMRSRLEAGYGDGDDATTPRTPSSPSRPSSGRTSSGRALSAAQGRDGNTLSPHGERTSHFRPFSARSVSTIQERKIYGDDRTWARTPPSTSSSLFSPTVPEYRYASSPGLCGILHARAENRPDPQAALLRPSKPTIGDGDIMSYQFPAQQGNYLMHDDIRPPAQRVPKEEDLWNEPSQEQAPSPRQLTPSERTALLHDLAGSAQGTAVARVRCEAKKGQAFTACFQSGQKKRYHVSNGKKMGETILYRAPKWHFSERCSTEWKRVVELSTATGMDRRLLMREFRTFQAAAGTDDHLQANEVMRLLSRTSCGCSSTGVTASLGEYLRKVFVNNAQKSLTFEQYVHGVEDIKRSIQQGTMSEVYSHYDLDDQGTIYRHELLTLVRKLVGDKAEQQALMAEVNATFDSLKPGALSMPFARFCQRTVDTKLYKCFKRNRFQGMSIEADVLALDHREEDPDPASPTARYSAVSPTRGNMARGASPQRGASAAWAARASSRSAAFPLVWGRDSRSPADKRKARMTWTSATAQAVKSIQFRSLADYVNQLLLIQRHVELRAKWRNAGQQVVKKLREDRAKNCTDGGRLRMAIRTYTRNAKRELAQSKDASGESGLSREELEFLMENGDSPKAPAPEKPKELDPVEALAESLEKEKQAKERLVKSVERTSKLLRGDTSIKRLTVARHSVRASIDFPQANPNSPKERRISSFNSKLSPAGSSGPRAEESFEVEDEEKAGLRTLSFQEDSREVHESDGSPEQQEAQQQQRWNRLETPQVRIAREEQEYKDKMKAAYEASKQSPKLEPRKPSMVTVDFDSREEPSVNNLASKLEKEGWNIAPATPDQSPA